jgi:inhibitor of KinA
MATHKPQAPRLLALGDAAWTVEFGQQIDAAINARVMGLAARIALVRPDEPLFAGVTDVVPTFRSLTLHFDPQITDAEALGARLLALAEQGGELVQQGRHWRLPVCFDPEFAPDMARVVEAKGLTEPAVLDRLLCTPFRVYMIGFLPGFPYMGGLPAELAMPRLASPRQRVPANSLAVAGEMCSVYPWESPGGWNLLGRTPVALFDLRCAEQPAMLAAGDWVHWHAVARDEYDHLLRCISSGELPRESFLQTEAEA